jgi:hypothetical protein
MLLHPGQNTAFELLSVRRIPDIIPLEEWESRVIMKVIRDRLSRRPSGQGLQASDEWSDERRQVADRAAIPYAGCLPSPTIRV